MSASALRRHQAARRSRSTGLCKGPEWEASRAIPQPSALCATSQRQLHGDLHEPVGSRLSIVVMTPVNAPTDTTVMAPTYAPPMTIIGLLNLRVVHVFWRGDAWFRL